MKPRIAVNTMSTLQNRSLRKKVRAAKSLEDELQGKRIQPLHEGRRGGINLPADLFPEAAAGMIDRLKTWPDPRLPYRQRLKCSRMYASHSSFCLGNGLNPRPLNNLYVFWQVFWLSPVLERLPISLLLKQWLDA
jgi:hypothetical protein